MKVNQKILSSDFLLISSTSWKNVLSLHLDRREGHPILVIGLVNGSTIEIPHLESSEMEAIFNAHEKHLLNKEFSQHSASKEYTSPYHPPRDEY